MKLDQKEKLLIRLLAKLDIHDEIYKDYEKMKNENSKYEIQMFFHNGVMKGLKIAIDELKNLKD